VSGKNCKVCGEFKSLESYRVDRLGVLGRQAKCKACRNREEMESGLNTSEAFRKKQARNRKANLEKYRDRENRWRRLNPEKVAAKNAARPPEPRDHQNARRAVRDAVKRGEIVRPETCNRCSATGRIYGHHHDYQKQLEVEWLCAACHRNEHLRLEAIASAIRAAGAGKTAESGHSPSTHNSESE